MRSRRRILQAAGAGLVGLAGCLDTAPGRGDTSPGDGGSPSEEPTDSESPSPSPLRTPPPGECSASDPPKPDTGDDLRAPLSYPEGPPSMTADAVGSFLADYQRAYATNELLAEVAADGRCLNNLDVSIDGVPRVRRTGSGFDVTVDWFRGYQTTHCATPTGTDTPTPGPHADVWGQTRYVVTERLLVREGTTLECWG